MLYLSTCRLYDALRSPPRRRENMSVFKLGFAMQGFATRGIRAVNSDRSDALRLRTAEGLGPEAAVVVPHAGFGEAGVHDIGAVARAAHTAGHDGLRRAVVRSSKTALTLTLSQGERGETTSLLAGPPETWPC